MPSWSTTSAAHSFAAGNENSFADAIHCLLSSADLREQQGNNARQFVEENFSLDRVLQPL